MIRPDLLIVDTGSANLASVTAAFRRLGVSAEISDDPSRICGAARIVLPGVGAFGDVTRRLRARGLEPALRQRFAEGAPALAICLGMQLLAERSWESPEATGLGVIRGTATRVSVALPVPQLGWNRVTAAPGGALICDGYAYFANSYCLTAPPDGWTPATANYGETFVAAIERGPQLACQFHPELSGDWGADLLERWMRAC